MVTKKKLGYLQFDGTEFGPFTLAELENVMQTGKIKGTLYVWFTGMDNWLPVSSTEEVSNIFEGTLSQDQKRLIKHQKLEVMQKREERNNGRTPLIATVSLEQETGKLDNIGVCADISASGMQIIVTNNQAFKVEAIHRFQVMPLTVSGLSPFKMSGKVMWFNADEGRVGLRFVNNSAEDSRLLNRYLDEYRRKKTTQLVS